MKGTSLGLSGHLGRLQIRWYTHTCNRTADPYPRLRVPVYRKAFEAIFFVSFLFLYYAVLIERNPTAIGVFEAILYVWIVAVAYDELSGLVDSGMLFYQMTFWNIWDLCIIGTGLIFVITSKLPSPCWICCGRQAVWLCKPLPTPPCSQALWNVAPRWFQGRFGYSSPFPNAATHDYIVWPVQLNKSFRGCWFESKGRVHYRPVVWHTFSRSIVSCAKVCRQIKHPWYCDSEHDVCNRIFSLVSLNPYFGSLVGAAYCECDAYSEMRTNRFALW